MPPFEIDLSELTNWVLIPGAMSESSPVWSPDGTSVAFRYAKNFSRVDSDAIMEFMATTSKDKRHAKGVLLIGLVKQLRIVKRQRTLAGLSPAAEAFLGERVLPHQWYPFEIYRELLNVVFKEILASNDEYTLRAGIAAGMISLTTFHQSFIKEGDPIISLSGMRHIWRSYFDFGSHKTERISDRSVRFNVTDFPDMLLVDGMMIIGWDYAAAQAAGANNVYHEILEAPWRGNSQLTYLISI